MRLLAIDIHLLDLPLAEPFVAAHGTTMVRTVAVVEITTDRGTGWGECSALPAATYTGESAAGCYRMMAGTLGPRLLGKEVVPDSVGPSLAPIGGPMAVSCVEMAVLDAWLKAERRSLAQWLDVDRIMVPAGVSIGLDSVPNTVAKARSLVDDGYQRLKVKIQPGHDTELISALRAELSTVELHIDANGAYGSEHLDHVLTLAESGVRAVEQPFAPSERSTTVSLIDRLAGSGVVVVADEAVQSVADAHALVDAGALTGLSIKPGRVGGLVAAVQLHDLCRDHDIPATAGGMLETGLGRHALAALAAMTGFTLAGDLSPAGRWLAADPWPDLEMVDGSIVVPAGPGVCFEPDRAMLDRHTVDSTELRADLGP